MPKIIRLRKNRMHDFRLALCGVFVREREGEKEKERACKEHRGDITDADVMVLSVIPNVSSKWHQ